ncbi:DUF397 domain-containing protein [Streptomyces sp. NPDC008125]|uniref:DUF397 domain-containing protein n=1 Tax=Streptomyces sp. NPDC008125 TaxID=3364811 RepID=UPI0036ED0C4F
MTERRIADSSTRTGWRKSSYSGAQGGSCLEVLDGLMGSVPVRDSKAPTGPALVISSGPWAAFVAAAVDGTFSP